jgi:DNA-binding XRE family transcriptional regulator
MNNRIKDLRKDLGLTQDEFAKKIDLSRNYINLIEMGKKIPADRTIRDICRTFSVNENWLTTGEGKMYLPQEDEEAAYVSELLLGSDNELYSIIKAIMKTYSELGEKEKKVLESFAKDLRNNLK